MVAYWMTADASDEALFYPIVPAPTGVAGAGHAHRNRRVLGAPQTREHEDIFVLLVLGHLIHGDKVVFGRLIAREHLGAAREVAKIRPGAAREIKAMALSVPTHVRA